MNISIIPAARLRPIDSVLDINSAVWGEMDFLCGVEGSDRYIPMLHLHSGVWSISFWKATGNRSEQYAPVDFKPSQKVVQEILDHKCRQMEDERRSYYPSMQGM